jgi:arylsulfatase A-like enzyme
MVSEVDHHVGRILDRLDALGIAENTVVVFTADHGEFLGEHLHYGKWWPAPDCVSRVPLIMRWPDEIVEPGRTVTDIVELTDLVPTLCDCAGRQTPPQALGQSLCPALSDPDADIGRESALLQDHCGMALRTDQYRYLFGSDGSEELYDLQADHGQYHDISDDRPDLLAEHRQLLLERQTDIALGSARSRNFMY